MFLMESHKDWLDSLKTILDYLSIQTSLVIDIKTMIIPNHTWNAKLEIGNNLVSLTDNSIRVNGYYYYLTS